MSIENVLNQMIEIEPLERQQFLIVKETLTRMRRSNKRP